MTTLSILFSAILVSDMRTFRNGDMTRFEIQTGDILFPPPPPQQGLLQVYMYAP